MQPDRMKLRDSQRSRVYAAEGLLPDFHTAGKLLSEVADMEKYVASIYAQAWFIDRWRGLQAPTIRPGAGARHPFFTAAGNTITMPRFCRSAQQLLHEVAHACIWYDCARRRYPDGVADHGREFCMVYLDLVRHYLGVPAHDRLREAFRTAKVRYKPKRAGRPGNAAALLAWRERKAAGALAPVLA